MLHEFAHNFTHNLFKPLLLFFYAGFLIPLLRVNFEFPKVIYQGLTIYLLLAIGWHGGEELATLGAAELTQALGFMVIGFITNTIVGFFAYGILRKATKLRSIDAATVAGYYGSDSAGTFLTAVGVLGAAQIAYAAYMPVLLAVMEIPGCLVALFLVSRMRQHGMDELGNMPGEASYRASQRRAVVRNRLPPAVHAAEGHNGDGIAVHEFEEELVGAAAGSQSVRVVRRTGGARIAGVTLGGGYDGPKDDGHQHHHVSKAEQQEADLALEHIDEDAEPAIAKPKVGFSKEMLHEVFLNPGIYLLFAGIAIGFLSRLQGESVTLADDELFVRLFQGMLCLFLLEMGMTASRKLKDLKAGGWQFILFGVLAPNVFAITGILIAHLYGLFLGQPFETGTYVLFAVLCAAASYIALPAVQRMAIPEASPTLPLAASLGLTFSYNVTIGIPMYILVAKIVTTMMPIASLPPIT
ncbi:MAG: sodium-dependent bicarbonate transport family permease [Planctomycetaceae bacterium]